MKLLPILLLLGSPSALAADPLGDFLSQTLARTDDAFQAAAAAPAEPAAPGVVFKQFFLGIAPKVSFGLSEVLDFEVSPDVTFVWEKTNLD